MKLVCFFPVSARQWRIQLTALHCGAAALICAKAWIVWASLVAQMVKNPPAMPGSGRSSREGNGNPCQCSCLENFMDRGAWRATVCGIIKSRTRLKNEHFAGSFTITVFVLLVQMSAQWKRANSVSVLLWKWFWLFRLSERAPRDLQGFTELC